MMIFNDSPRLLYQPFFVMSSWKYVIISRSFSSTFCLLGVFILVQFQCRLHGVNFCQPLGLHFYLHSCSSTIKFSLAFLIQDNTGVCVNQSEYSFSFLFRFSSIDFIIGIIYLSFGYQFVVVIFSVFAMNLFSLVVTQPPPQAFLGEIVFLPYKRPRGRLVITELQWFKGSYALLFMINMSMLSDCYQQFYRRITLITLQAKLVYFLVLFSSHSLFGIIGFQSYIFALYVFLAKFSFDFIVFSSNRLCTTLYDLYRFHNLGTFCPVNPPHASILLGHVAHHVKWFTWIFGSGILSLKSHNP